MGVTAPSWELRYSRKLFFTDAGVILASLATGLGVARGFYLGDPSGFHLPTDSYTSGSTLIAAFYGIIWMSALSIYDSRRPAVFGTGPEEYNRVLGATVTALGAATLLLFLLNMPPQRSFLIALTVGLLLLLLGRWAWRKRLHAQRRKKLNSYRTLLVGNRKKARHVAQQLRANVLAGFNIVGVVTASAKKTELLPKLPVVATYDDLLEAAKRLDIDTIIVTSADAITPRRLRELGWELEEMKINLIVATTLTDVAGPQIHARPVAGLPLIHVEYPQFRGWRYIAKRALDLTIASIVLFLTSPFLIAFAILIKRDSPGPVLFSQKRLGLNGKPFTMYKFRSMNVDAEEQLVGLLDKNDGNEVLFKLHNDPRVTELGKFIRRHSIDELPQLINVLKGEMSLVGPRPPLPREAEGYEEWMHRRMFVRPGMSGLWQVSGRSELTWEESLRIDLYYVENWSLTGDLLILWRTFRAVFKGDGAY